MKFLHNVVVVHKALPITILRFLSITSPTVPNNWVVKNTPKKFATLEDAILETFFQF